MDKSFLSEELIESIAVALDGLCYQASRQVVKLRPLKISSCNAANQNSGFAFSNAYCEVEKDLANKTFLFGDIFRRGLDILLEYIEDKKVPSNKQEEFVLNKFIQYVVKDESLKMNELEDKTETELTTLLANHLFGQLSTSSQFIIDKHCGEKQKPDKCPCGKEDCKLTGIFGDTSVGNGEVWHGNLDIIINNEVFIEPLENKPESPLEKPPEEVKLNDAASLMKNHQIIAKTIVFSFLQKQRHPERDHFLTPCIGISCTHMLIMFYDSKNDVLFESTSIPIIDSKGEFPDQISTLATIISWLVVNYRYLCSGLTEDMLLSSFTADFFKQAKTKLCVYETKLSLGNVWNSFPIENRGKKRENVISSNFLYKKHKKLSKIICKGSSSDCPSSSES